VEMFTNLVNRGSFASVLVPTLLGQFPRASTKPNVPCLLRLARPLTPYDTRYNFRLPRSPRSERGAASEHFIDNYSESIDVCLLGNPGIVEAEHLRVEQFGGHVRPSTLELVDARRYGKGDGGYEGRKAKVGDACPSGRSVLNEDVPLREVSCQHNEPSLALTQWRTSTT